MLNKINTLLVSTSTTVIKEFNTTSYVFSSPATGSTITLPAGITEGSLGLILIGETKTSAGGNAVTLATPTGFTLISKTERINSGTGNGGTQGLFYKYMTASDSSTIISTIFGDSAGAAAEVVFIEVILNKNIKIKGFDSLNAGAGSAGGNTVTLTDVPSVIPNNNPFFLLTCRTDNAGTPGFTFSGGMEAYYTSTLVINTTTNRIVCTLWKYDNVKIQDLPDTADVVFESTASSFGSTGAYMIWLK